MAKPNYQFEKRQRELEKKKKKAEKAQRKASLPDAPPPSEAGPEKESVVAPSAGPGSEGR